MAFGCTCSPDALCDACVHDAFQQLRGVAACRGERWASIVATRADTSRPWPHTAKAHAIAVRKVNDIAHDARLRERLADELERWAERRWDSIRTDAFDSRQPSP